MTIHNITPNLYLIRTTEGRVSLNRHSGPPIARVQALPWSSFLCAEVTIDPAENELHVCLAAGPYLAVTVTAPGRLIEGIARLAKRGLRGTSEYDSVTLFRASIHHRALWWDVFHTEDVWHSDTPRWRHGSFDPIDAIFGSSDYSSTVLSEHEVDIPLPEGTYTWKVELRRCEWKRPRWPRAKVRYTYEATPLEGQKIPFPGKGENAWDCGSDALHGAGGPAKTIDEAVTSIVGGVLRSRRRHGSGLTYVTGGKYDAQERSA